MSDPSIIIDRRQPVASSSYPWYVLPGMAIMAELIFATALIMSFMGEDKTLLNVMCTAAIAQAAGALNYYFGSSAGSAKKDEAAALDNRQKTTALAASAPVTTLTTTTEEAKPAALGEPSKSATTTTEMKTGPAGAPDPGQPTQGPNP